MVGVRINPVGVGSGIGIAGCDRVLGGGSARCMRNEGVYYVTGRVGLPCGEPT